jgi:myo-inositol 2-dehydrogenase/D-chiro-inositol 1-dehydrogenase
VFDLPDVDAVVISTTTNTHAPLTIKAIQKGKVSAAAAACPCWCSLSDEWPQHVLLEKPISIDVADSKPVVEVANANPSVKVMIGFVRRCEWAAPDS